MHAAKIKSITGWGLTLLIVFFLAVVSATGKFIDWEGKTEMFATLGYSTELMWKIGILEVALAVLILIPRAAFLGAVLLTAYLGGAVATHVRVGDAYFFPILAGLFLWIAIGLRRPEVFRLAFGPASPQVSSSPAAASVAEQT